ncbi:hypothetical protein TRV_04964 [Trichophyton verrucosum HKI 0517]|uniref:Uncharacterized protein n=1 Tax=Trichophyton verrucosum (strain HKI 0517) TaxID=663202 RepID=D4DCV8_TRIVH|nr:uncharacterized protein TRV_04964 [Trichophyton verrucosum HKI 0517]EFE40270.1 hypothetical protein TRV_04964 [Trichophyton verrucosum HKI 0517]
MRNMTRRRIRRRPSFSRPSAPEPAAAKLSRRANELLVDGCLAVRLPGDDEEKEALTEQEQAPSLLRTSPTKTRARRDTRQEEADGCERTTRQAGCSMVDGVPGSDGITEAQLALFCPGPSSEMRVLLLLMWHRMASTPSSLALLLSHAQEKTTAKKQLCGLWTLNRLLSTCETDTRRRCLCWRYTDNACLHAMTCHDGGWCWLLTDAGWSSPGSWTSDQHLACVLHPGWRFSLAN